MNRGWDNLGLNRGFGSVMDIAVPIPEIEAPIDPRAQLHQHIVRPSAPRPASNTGSLAQFVRARLASATPKAKELIAEREMILSCNVIDLDAADAFLAACKEERDVDLAQRQAEFKRQCRKQAAVCAKLEQEFANAELSLMNIAAASDAANQELVGLNIIEKQGRHVPRWATEAELSEWQSRVDRAKGKVTKANEKAVIALQIRNQAQARLEEANKEMNRVGHEERRLAAEISGQPYTDPEFGLSSVPVAQQ